MPALGARGPDVGGRLCLICKAEMEISGSPVRGMHTRRIADETENRKAVVFIKSQKHLR